MPTRYWILHYTSNEVMNCTLSTEGTIMTEPSPGCNDDGRSPCLYHLDEAEVSAESHTTLPTHVKANICLREWRGAAVQSCVRVTTS